MDMTYLDIEMEEVTLSEAMLPQNRFERVSMTKVWVMGKGPAASTFDDVEAHTCGFLGNVRFRPVDLQQRPFHHGPGSPAPCSRTPGSPGTAGLTAATSRTRSSSMPRWKASGSSNVR